MQERFTNTVEQKRVLSSSAGSRADQGADVNIATVCGKYFSSPEVARPFVDTGIQIIEKELPRHVRYADFGGGHGFLTRTVARYLESCGHTVEAFVIDSNEKSLAAAEQTGLSIQHCNLESCHFPDADLITMRAVNHYNQKERQIEILKRAWESLRNGGFLLSQISTGSTENCVLRSEVLNLESLGKADGGERYQWVPTEEYLEMLATVGFKESSVVGHAPDWQFSLEEMWDRFNGKTSREAAERADDLLLRDLERRKNIFFGEAQSIIERLLATCGQETLGVTPGTDGTTLIHYRNPIIKSQH